jgi:hypothetical protein
LNRAIDFVLDCQREDGLFSLEAPIQPADDWNAATQTATYNHAIAGLMLAEAYGLSDGTRDKRIRPAIERGLVYTRRLQRRRKGSPIDVRRSRVVPANAEREAELGNASR